MVQSVILMKAGVCLLFFIIFSHSISLDFANGLSLLVKLRPKLSIAFMVLHVLYEVYQPIVLQLCFVVSVCLVLMLQLLSLGTTHCTP